MRFELNQPVVNPFVPGVALFGGEDGDKVCLKYGPKDVRKIPMSHPAAQMLRSATDEEIVKSRVERFLSNHTHSFLIRTYINWLREAGPQGVLNDCGCEKDAFWNYTCACRTMVKLYHRFSVFKDELIKEGYIIENVELDTGKNKTILHKEPYSISEVN